MAQYRWYCIKDTENRCEIIFPKTPCQVVLDLQFRDEKGAWSSTYKRCYWNGTEFERAPIKPSARAKRIFWRKVEEKTSVSAKSITCRDTNNVVWHPYLQEIPATENGRGSFLLTCEEDGHMFLVIGYWTGKRFWLSKGRKSSIRAWAYAPALFEGTNKE